MTIEPAIVRAKRVLAANNYFALATQDADGPWVAALAFTFLAPNYLCFFSQATSRHGAAIRQGAKVAGLIYDSQCAGEEAESIQFSGWGEARHDRDTIAAVLQAAHSKGGNPPPTNEEIDKHALDDKALLFRVSVDEAFVLDQEIYNQKGIDARERIDPVQLFSDAWQ